MAQKTNPVAQAALVAASAVVLASGFMSVYYARPISQALAEWQPPAWVVRSVSPERVTLPEPAAPFAPRVPVAALPAAARPPFPGELLDEKDAEKRLERLEREERPATPVEAAAPAHPSYDPLIAEEDARWSHPHPEFPQAPDAWEWEARPGEHVSVLLRRR